MNTIGHSARESWCGDISIVVTSSIVRAQLQCGCSPSSMGLFVGRTYRTFSLPFAGPNCWAVMSAGFWKSRALSQHLPSSVQMVGEAGVPGMACFSRSSQTQQLGQEKSVRTETMYSPPNRGSAPREAILAMQRYSVA